MYYIFDLIYIKLCCILSIVKIHLSIVIVNITKLIFYLIYTLYKTEHCNILAFKIIIIYMQSHISYTCMF